MSHSTVEIALLQQLQLYKVHTLPDVQVRVSELMPGDLFGDPAKPTLVLAAAGGVHAPHFESPAWRMLWTVGFAALRHPLTRPLYASHYCYFQTKPLFGPVPDDAFADGVWHRSVPLVGRLEGYTLTPAVIAAIRAARRRDARQAETNAVLEATAEWLHDFSGTPLAKVVL